MTIKVFKSCKEKIPVATYPKSPKLFKRGEVYRYKGHESEFHGVYLILEDQKSSDLRTLAWQFEREAMCWLLNPAVYTQLNKVSLVTNEE